MAHSIFQVFPVETSGSWDLDGVNGSGDLDCHIHHQMAEAPLYAWNVTNVFGIKLLGLDFKNSCQKGQRHQMYMKNIFV